MGKDFLRLVELAIASGVLVIPGVEPLAHAGPADQGTTKTADTSAPTVRSARLDRSGLTIEFSEALAPATRVDPNKFRLTFAYYSKGRPGSYSYYYDYYGSHRPLTVYSDVGRKALKARIDQPKPNQLKIPATPELNLSSICDEVSSPATQGKTGLYLHYADGGSPRVESLRGKPLASIAPYWLAKEDTTVVPGSLQGRPIPVSVSCR
jgi:hypothetical protein